MFDIVKKELNISVISSILYIILGIIIVLNPAEALLSLSIFIACSAIVFGIILTAINITTLRTGGNLLFGILLIVIGIALLMYPGSLNLLISLGIGLWIISNSASRIKFAFMIKDIKVFNWLTILIPSIITLLIGISFIFAPLASAITLAIIAGSLMIAYSIIDLCEILFIKKNVKSIEKAFNVR